MKSIIKAVVIGSFLSLAVLNASAESGNQEPQKTDKAQSQVKPHSHPADKGTVPTSDGSTKNKQDATKDVSNKHSHPADKGTVPTTD